MFRFTMIVSILCALCFMSAAPTDLEARCGGGSSGRSGLLSRFRNRLSSRANYGYRSNAVYRQSTYQSIPVMMTPVCPCPPPQQQQVPAPAVVVPQQKTSYVFPQQSYTPVTILRSRSSGGGCPGGVCPINR